MDELQAYYRGSLRNRIEALETVRETLARHDPEALQSVRRIAHSLKGTGATYGFSEVTTAAGAVLEAEEGGILEATEALIGTLRRVAGTEPEDAAKILLVEDDGEMVRLLDDQLAGPNRRVLAARTGAEAEEILAKSDVDLILLDLILPDGDGRNLLAQLRGNPKYAAIPILVITARVGKHIKAECYALGADEYFEKPLDPSAVAAAVASKLLRAGEISREARHDPLTGLLNRAGLTLAFERASALASRARYPLSLALADVDQLKWINDHGGHALGDRVLCRLSELFILGLRRSDRVGRWGGDEFVALFPDGEPGGAARALEKVLRVLREEPFETPGGERFEVGFSAGVVAVAPGSGLEEVVAAADQLLYLAKSECSHRVLTAGDRTEASRRRVLFAEDDPAAAALVLKHLAAADFDVVHRADGLSALEAAESGAFDLAILDIVMPGLDGFGLLERLRRSPAHARTPVIMLTALGSEKEVLRAFDLGADDYVVKPFSPLELLARARRLLKATARRRR